MKCPYCNKETKIADVVKLNLERYGGSVKARTQCCTALIRVSPIVTFRCEKTNQDELDDWGN